MTRFTAHVLGGALIVLACLYAALSFTLSLAPWLDGLTALAFGTSGLWCFSRFRKLFQAEPSPQPSGNDLRLIIVTLAIGLALGYYGLKGASL